MGIRCAWHTTESLLLQGAGLTGLEKRKSQLDYLVSKNTAKTPFPRFDGGGTCPGAACGEYL